MPYLIGKPGSARMTEISLLADPSGVYLPASQDSTVLLDTPIVVAKPRCVMPMAFLVFCPLFIVLAYFAQFVAALSTLIMLSKGITLTELKLQKARLRRICSIAVLIICATAVVCMWFLAKSL